jgi:hypothetical protein
MKKTLLILVAAAALLVPPLQAQITFTASPSAQTIDLSSTNVFNVTFTLTVGAGGPAMVNGFDLFVETNTTNNPNGNGFFSITGATALLPGSDLPSGTPSYPDTISTAGSDHADFAQNVHSQGFTSDTDTSTANPVPLETLSFSIDPSTPAGTYFFRTTNDATSTDKFSLISDANNNAHPVDNDATFSITVVPEPATWSLVVLGGVGCVGLGLIRRKRRA